MILPYESKETLYYWIFITEDLDLNRYDLNNFPSSFPIMSLRTDSYERVREYFSKLGLTTIEGTIDSYLETSRGKTLMDILDHLLSDELRHKLSKNTKNMLNCSGFPFRKTMDDLRFYIPAINRSIGD